MASIPLANPMNKWRLDLCGSAGSRTLMLRSAAADQSLNPPGYNPGLSTTQQSESANRAEQQQQHLLSKRAWDLALQPVKSLPMNMFMMYMAGKAPGKCVSGKCVSGKSVILTLDPQNCFCLGEFMRNCIGRVQMSHDGSSPKPCFWLDFVPPLERAQYALFNDI
ncbi:hypothetical protein niasHT_035885 [Heterodera trifolii]|uniref:ER membrane protein complex subunit 4 n=1 Tax=Heterodera trifolii TaxID=157864 RepID=A0ABD2IHT0_9BILA